MKNWIKLNQVPYLFAAVCLGLFSLIAFQISWLTQSRQLIEEQFDQKVSLALGSALSDFNTAYSMELEFDEFSEILETEDNAIIDLDRSQVTPAQLADLEESLHGYMTCYGIDQDYKIDILDNIVNADSIGCSYACSLNTLNGCCSSYAIGVSFDSKDQYLFDKMKFMILSSILIFLLLSGISFFILWALIKQKRITENNIDFFNNTAHELKTPLTNISLALNLLTRRHKEIKQDKYVDIIKRENSKLAEQVERVLFLSKMENGEYLLKLESINLKEVIKEVVANMQMIIEGNNGTIEFDFPNEDYMVMGDKYHLSNVFKNLIDNALKYCDCDPKINISLNTTEEGIKVLFSDNGIGISKGDQVHIFEKFQRVNTGDIKDAKGFGIGLSYVKTVVEMHKGMIKVLSEINKGSQFEVYIPNT